MGTLKIGFLSIEKPFANGVVVIAIPLFPEPPGLIAKIPKLTRHRSLTEVRLSSYKLTIESKSKPFCIHTYHTLTACVIYVTD